jgi:23S rRNA (cytidine1920-2'-O)/16S rRNA (cytidine1409-2'-O)-methyltransferase
MKQLRIDLWLNLNGFANSRTHAAALIEQGQIEIRTSLLGTTWNKVSKPSLKVSESMPPDCIRLIDGPGNRFVSRGGLKLEGAINHLNLNLTGLRILDVGVSTGGFTDCCLQKGAAIVVGVDVGHDQISPRLAQHTNFILFEGLNAKNLNFYRESISELQRPFDLIVGDLSFISILAVLPHLASFLTVTGRILFLVKPQFELESGALSKNGVVKDPHYYDIVKNKVLATCQTLELSVEDYFSSSIEGKDGNKEFFLFAIPKGKLV